MDRPAALPAQPKLPDLPAPHVHPGPNPGPTPSDLLAELARLRGSVRWMPLGAAETTRDVAEQAGAGADPDVCLLRFDAAGFDTAWFGAARIAHPPGIAHSVPKRQAEYFYGRYLAQLAMQRLGRPGADVAIGPAREPLWPAGLIGSISHSQQYAAAVAIPAGRRGGVGIDLEHIVCADAQQALLATAISPRELDYLQGLRLELPLNTLVTIVFSAKESLYKGAYATVRRFFDFSAAQLTVFDAANGRLSLTLTEPLAGMFGLHSVWHIRYRFIDEDTVFTSFVC